MSDLFGNSLIVATSEHCKARWACGKPGEKFRCGFCGYKFRPDDKYRAIFTNDMVGYGYNPLVCEKCNKPNDELRAEWKAKIDAFVAIANAPENWKMLSFLPIGKVKVINLKLKWDEAYPQNNYELVRITIEPVTISPAKRKVK